jgi:hypothetical protein
MRLAPSAKDADTSANVEDAGTSMGTISHFKDWLQRRNQAAERPPVSVNAHGFVVGGTFVPWQAVSDIRAWKVDSTTTCEALLEFAFAGQCMQVSEGQVGFAELETAMMCVFPSTANWRDAMLLAPSAGNPALLYRRC